MNSPVQAQATALITSEHNAALIEALGGGSADDLVTGVGSGFAVMSIRGGKWRIKVGGEETLVRNADGDPTPSIDVLILKSSPDVSKNYYEGKYVEGSDDPPTCFSTNGHTPAAEVQNPQSRSCASCPKNAFGSRITEAGKKAKACNDVRRLAVVPFGDLPNEQYGGPMLLRVPTASLQELAAYGKAMKARGFAYNLIGTRLSFDTEVSYPRIKFRPVTVLKSEQQEQLLQLLADPTYADKITSILNRAEEAAAAAPVAAAPAPTAPAAPADQYAFVEDEPEVAPAPAPAPAPAAQRAKPAAAQRAKPAAAPAPAPAAQRAKPAATPLERSAAAVAAIGGEPDDEPEAGAATVEDDIDSLLASLDG